MSLPFAGTNRIRFFGYYLSASALRRPAPREQKKRMPEGAENAQIKKSFILCCSAARVCYLVPSFFRRPLRSAVRTPGFHPGNTGSIPVGVAIQLFFRTKHLTANHVAHRMALSDQRESKGWQAQDFFFLKTPVYLLRCSNGTYYVGHTDDVVRRLEEHNFGKGAEHTRKYRPVKLIYTEPFDSEGEALRREMQIKRWSRAKKAALASGEVSVLKKLAKRRVA